MKRISRAVFNMVTSEVGVGQVSDKECVAIEIDVCCAYDDPSTFGIAITLDAAEVLSEQLVKHLRCAGAVPLQENPEQLEVQAMNNAENKCVELAPEVAERIPDVPECAYWNAGWKGWREFLGTDCAVEAGATCACGQPAVDKVKGNFVCEDCLTAKLKLPYAHA